MNKTGYLKTPIVHEFINYFSGLIEGKSINHQYEIRDTKLPDGYKEDHCEKDGSLKIDNLEDAFKKYWWKSKDYYQNKRKLDQLEKDIKGFHNKEDKDPDQCYELIKEVFKWGGVWHVNKRGVGKVENKDHLIKLEDAIKVVSNTQYFTLAESLGGVESLICHPSSMTHAAIPREEREKTGVVESLIRLSVGIEDIDDLISDLNTTFDLL